MRTRIVCAALLSAIGLTLTLIRFLPFQDVPNHVHLLDVDRALRAGTLSPAAGEFYRAPDVTAFGYSLHVWIGRLAAAWAGPAAILRFMFVISALGLPLAAGRLARAVGADPARATLLAVPLGLGWPLHLGLIAYVLALPAFLWTLAAAVELARRPSPHKCAELAVASTLCYLAHPVPLAAALAGSAVVWISRGRRVALATAAFAAALAPVAMLLVTDVGNAVFGQVPGTDVTWNVPSLQYRSPGVALAHLVTRSFCIENPLALACFAPLLAFLGWVLVRGMRQPGSPRILAAAGLFVMAVSAAMPWSIGLAFELGSRVAIIGMSLLAVAAAGWRWPVPRLAPLAVVLPVAFLLGDMAARSRHLEELLGGRAPRALSGRYLSARVAPCKTTKTLPWGVYEPEWHLWAYAMSADGVDPYLFAFSRYLPVWFRSNEYVRWMKAPDDVAMNAPLLANHPAACEEYNRWRINLALARGKDFDGVLLTGEGGDLARHLRTIGFRVGSTRWLAPGMVLVSARPADLAMH